MNKKICIIVNAIYMAQYCVLRRVHRGYGFIKAVQENLSKESKESMEDCFNASEGSKIH